MPNKATKPEADAQVSLQSVNGSTGTDVLFPLRPMQPAGQQAFCETVTAGYLVESNHLSRRSGIVALFLCPGRRWSGDRRG